MVATSFIGALIYAIAAVFAVYLAFISVKVSNQTSSPGSVLIDNLDKFEHFDDFTIASSWERFISKIEAICRPWMADGPNNLLLIAPQSASGVVLDAPEASRLLSAVAIVMSNSLKDYGGFLSSLQL
ncbi:uncharacterized protein DS421_3g73880 [Arachis hypogaea]|nr:uncharacterized protein DS421_3g73880 [Arachis hypogaea]